MKNQRDKQETTSDYYYGQTRSDMLVFVPSNSATVLEIGCGNGEFSRAIKSKCDAEIWGVELNSAAAEQASKHIHKILCGPIENHIDSLPNGYFDCICMNDVIEHLVDPWQVLSSLRKKLRPNGVVVASIPNVRHYKNLGSLLFKGDWQYTDSGTLDRTHLRFFTHKSMQRLFSDTNYTVKKIQGLKHSRKFKLKIFNLLFGGKLWDISYLQFAIVASPIEPDKILTT